MKTIASSVLLFLCCAIALGQERILEKSEFDALVTGANSHHLKWKDNTYRMTVTTSSKAEGRPQTDYSAKMVFEYGPESAFHSVSTSMFADKPSQTMESMRIGQWSYTRTGTGPWTRKEVGSQTGDRPRAENGDQVLSAEYKYLGIVDLMGKPARMYAKTERQMRGSTEVNVTATYWIGDDGVMRKSEYNSEGRGPIVSHTLVTTVWELDPTIKFIEPPVAS